LPEPELSEEMKKQIERETEGHRRVERILSSPTIMAGVQRSIEEMKKGIQPKRLEDK
jgi:hypothetical protein